MIGLLSFEPGQHTGIMVSEESFTAAACSPLRDVLRSHHHGLAIRWMAGQLAWCVLQELWVIGVFIIQPLLFVGVAVTILSRKTAWAMMAVFFQGGVLGHGPAQT